MMARMIRWEQKVSGTRSCDTVKPAFFVCDLDDIVKTTGHNNSKSLAI